MPRTASNFPARAATLSFGRIALVAAGCAPLWLGAACTKSAPTGAPGEGADAKTLVQSAGRAPADKPPLARAQASIMPLGGSKVSGTLMFSALQDGAGVRVQGALAGLTPGSHGIHVHQVGDCSAADGSSAGGHFDPTAAQHGAIDDTHSHVGDLGNLVADKEGRASFDVIKKSATLADGAATDLVGHSIIVHAGEDDLHSQPAGASGDRIACGKIDKI